MGSGFAQSLRSCGSELRAGDEGLAAGAGIDRSSCHIPNTHRSLAPAAVRMVVDVPAEREEFTSFP